MTLIKNGEEWLDTETGEVITKKRLDELNDKVMFGEHNKYLKNTIDYDLDPKYMLIKKREQNEPKRKTVKEGYKFNMIHRTDLMEVMETIDISHQAGYFIFKTQPFIKYPYNDVQIRNEYYTLQQFCEFCKFGKNMMTKVIKELEELEIIKVVKGGNKPPIIYYNPFLYAAGRDVDVDTYMMFAKSKYNPDVANYQDKKFNTQTMLV